MNSQRVGNILIVADTESELAHAVIDMVEKERGIVIIGMHSFAQSLEKLDESLLITKESVLKLSEAILPKEYTNNPHKSKSGKIIRR